MAETFARFGKNIRKRRKQFDRRSAKAVTTAASAGLRSVVRNTPADKGVARSNWRVGIGAPTRKVIQAYRPYPKGSMANGRGTAETANAGAAIAAGLARIKASEVAGLTSAIYISNNVPYIRKLNAGSSKQAPAGFIETSLLEAKASLVGFKLFTDAP